MAALRPRLLAALLLVAAAAPAAAQSPPGQPAAAVDTAESVVAPVFLEPGHWAWGALRRLHVAGLAPAMSDPAVAPVTLRQAMLVFDASAARALEAGHAGLAAQAGDYAGALTRESRWGAPLAALHVRAGWTVAAGEALAGDGYTRDVDWEGAQPIGDARSAAVAVSAHGWATPWLAWSLDAGHLADELRVVGATLGASAGPVDLWAGRRRLHYGVGRGGGTVLGAGIDDVPDVAFRTLYDFEGIGIHVRDPFHYPWLLRFLGESRVEMVAGRLPRKGQVRRPYVIFGRLFSTPFSPRFTLGVNRGAIFAGEDIPVTFGRMLGLLAGMHGGEHGEFENQVFSAIARYRPPLGPLPLEAYVEVGMDDTAGAIRDVPGIIGGFDLGPLPSLPALSVGVERTHIAESCCGNTIWYRNVFYGGAWADRGRLIAHPLGGHGDEWLGHARIDLPERGVFLRGEVFVRRRGHENLFAPEREGRSGGAGVVAEYRPGRGTSLRVDGVLERGRAWDLHRFSVMLSHALAPRR
jgi:hypothetical protein